MASRQKDIDELGAQFFAISVDDLSNAGFIADSTGIPFPVLYDPAAETVREFGVFDLLGDGLATPSTFVIDADGIIRWKYVGQRIGDRPSVDTILSQVAALGS